VKRVVALILFFAALVLAAFAQEDKTSTNPAKQAQQEPTIAQLRAKVELQQAAIAYRAGKYAEAQWHSEQALAVDPENSTAALYVARCIHAQFKPGDKSDLNRIKAGEAVDAYKRILATDPQNEEAYKAIAHLYDSIKEEELLRRWLLQRATDQSFTPAKRAEAYVVLGSKDWNCSFQLTDLPANKITSAVRNRVHVRYSKPQDPRDFEKAKECATNGLDMIEMAISLDPDNEAAWSYKTNLFLELSKLAEMDNDLNLKADYKHQADAAQDHLFEVIKNQTRQQPNKP
jgi:tetratricopeptide (TPR) repeat protein